MLTVGVLATGRVLFDDSDTDGPLGLVVEKI